MGLNIICILPGRLPFTGVFSGPLSNILIKLELLEQMLIKVLAVQEMCEHFAKLMRVKCMGQMYNGK